MELFSHTEELERLRQENSELRAHVARMNAAIRKASKNVGVQNETASYIDTKALVELRNAEFDIPAQSLADIQAEAIEALAEKIEYKSSLDFHDDRVWWQVEDCLDFMSKYAKQLREQANDR